MSLYKPGKSSKSLARSARQLWVDSRGFYKDIFREVPDGNSRSGPYLSGQMSSEVLLCTKTVMFRGIGTSIFIFEFFTFGSAWPLVTREPNISQIRSGRAPHLLNNSCFSLMILQQQSLTPPRCLFDVGWLSVS